jgi:magnesium transporter
MLASDSIDEIRDFCDSTPPPVAAEFLGALTAHEEWEILLKLPPSLRSLIFSHLDDDIKLSLSDILKDDDFFELIARMPDEKLADFFKLIPPDRQKNIWSMFKESQSAEILAVASHLEHMLESEMPIEEEILTDEEIASEISHEINVYKIVENKVEKINRIEKGCWVNIVNPSKDNLPLIAKHFNIPVDFLIASLDIDEIARVEVEDNATLIIAKVPYFDEKNIDVLYLTIPIGIILVNGNILTVCAKEDNLLDDFINHKVKNVSTVNGHKFILQIILRATLLYLQYLKQLNNAASIVQKKLEQESRNKQLIKLFNIEKSLVYFTTSLKTNMLMIEKLQRVKILTHDEENENLLEDIATESKQALEMANIYSDILSGMMDAFASIISNNLNIVMKVLTSITIIMTIPISVTSFFSMNVILPMHEHPYAFFIIVSLSMLLSVLAILFFVKRKWLVP